MAAAPTSLTSVSGSPNSHADSNITLTTSRCDAANAGPIGAFFSRPIHTKNAPT
jgi:hypothetical protein